LFKNVKTSLHLGYNVNRLTSLNAIDTAQYVL